MGSARPAWTRRSWLASAAAVAAGAASGSPRARPLPVAPLLAGLDGHSHPVDSADALARRYVQQGFMLVYAFNPAEAARSFEAAAARDAGCALAWWGLAWALGPNINTDPEPADAPRISLALARAGAARASATVRELVQLLAFRHPREGELQEEAYAEAAVDLARRRPRDAFVQLLAAEAQLNLHPYDWWQPDGRPQPWTPSIERLLQRSLALDPRQPGAHHYWIHLQESSPQPARADASAAFLRSAYPGAPHLLHMPSHIDLRTGRYAEAIAANQRAIAADAAYLAQVDAQSAYRVGYVAHNQHFLWAAAGMAGRQGLALQAADEAGPAACGPGGRNPGTATVQHLLALPFLTRQRFGLWEELATGTRPPDGPGGYALALWHAARGCAFARLGRPREAQVEAERLQALTSDPAVSGLKVKNLHPVGTLLALAAHQLRAEQAAARGDADAAVAALQAAVALEDTLAYDEPHVVGAPVRQALGAALLAAGRPAEALRAYDEDLRHYPANAWSLQGRAQALNALGRPADAARAAADSAWSGAQRRPAGSRF